MSGSQSNSPNWTTTTKLVVALTAVAIAAALLFRFHNIIGPVLMSFILAYLLHPLATFLDVKAPLSWRGAVNSIYLVLLVVLIALLTLGGVGLVQQIQSLINVVEKYIEELPAFLEDLSGQVYAWGPIQIDLSQLDLVSIGEQALSAVQPALGELGSLVGTVAGSAASTLGWLFFILIVSYFFLIESGGLRERILQIDLPGYAEDINRLGFELGRIWNAFLRGQIIIFIITVITYTILLTILGVRYSLGLALIAGFANFLPYVGPAINWVVLALVTLFQVTPFGLTPVVYMVIVVSLALLVDQVFNSVVVPRVMAQSLKVHPAFILIAAIIAANLLGVLGLIIAAPLLATLKLASQYTLRKMLDAEPWPEEEQSEPPRPPPRWYRRLRVSWRRFLRRRRGIK